MNDRQAAAGLMLYGLLLGFGVGWLAWSDSAPPLLKVVGVVGGALFAVSMLAAVVSGRSRQ